MSLRGVAKSIAYKLGVLDMFHRARHRECLTVLMFHRVLPPDERDRSGADPLYTVTPEFLAETISFANRNYSVVDIHGVLASLDGARALPPWPLLVTFDDGWRDNLIWALPVLRGTPWTLFVATEAVSDPDCWWQEELLRVLRSGRASFEELWKNAAPEESSAGEINHDILELFARYARLAPERRRCALTTLESVTATRDGSRDMLTAAELASLRSEGVEIGTHGASHLPLSRIDDPAADLRRSMEWLRPLNAQRVMSYPHGRYNQNTINAARNAGFVAQFTSDAILNPCPGGWLHKDVIGRISLGTTGASDAHGAAASERLAGQLYLRDIRFPAANIA